MAFEGHRNLEWNEHNAVRNYPFDITANLVSTDTNFIIPRDFLVGAYFAFPWERDVSISNFFVREIINVPSLVKVYFAYTPIGGPADDIGFVEIYRSTFNVNNVYQLTPTSDWQDVIAHIVVGGLPDTSQPVGAFEFTLENARLDSDALRPSLRFLKGIEVEQSDGSNQFLTDLIRLRPGTNVRLETNVVSAGVYDLFVHAIDGEGLSAACLCGDTLSDPIRRINMVPGDINGNMNIIGAKCLEIDTQPGLISLENPCSDPCCGCEEAEALTQALAPFGNQAVTLQNTQSRLEAAINQLQTIISLYDLRGECGVVEEEEEPLSLTKEVQSKPKEEASRSIKDIVSESGLDKVVRLKPQDNKSTYDVYFTDKITKKLYATNSRSDVVELAQLKAAGVYSSVCSLGKFIYVYDTEGNLSVLDKQGKLITSIHLGDDVKGICADRFNSNILVARYDRFELYTNELSKIKELQHQGVEAVDTVAFGKYALFTNKGQLQAVEIHLTNPKIYSLANIFVFGTGVDKVVSLTHQASAKIFSAWIATDKGEVIHLRTGADSCTPWDSLLASKVRLNTAQDTKGNIAAIDVHVTDLVIHQSDQLQVVVADAHSNFIGTFQIGREKDMPSVISRCQPAALSSVPYWYHAKVDLNDMPKWRIDTDLSVPGSNMMYQPNVTASLRSSYEVAFGGWARSTGQIVQTTNWVRIAPNMYRAAVLADVKYTDSAYILSPAKLRQNVQILNERYIVAYCDSELDVLPVGYVCLDVAPVKHMDPDSWVGFSVDSADSLEFNIKHCSVAVAFEEHSDVVLFSEQSHVLDGEVGTISPISDSSESWFEGCSLKVNFQGSPKSPVAGLFIRKKDVLLKIQGITPKSSEVCTLIYNKDYAKELLPGSVIGLLSRDERLDGKKATVLKQNKENNTVEVSGLELNETVAQAVWGVIISSQGNALDSQQQLIVAPNRAFNYKRSWTGWPEGSFEYGLTFRLFGDKEFEFFCAGQDTPDKPRIGVKVEATKNADSTIKVVVTSTTTVESSKSKPSVSVNVGNNDDSNWLNLRLVKSQGSLDVVLEEVVGLQKAKLSFPVEAQALDSQYGVCVKASPALMAVSEILVKPAFD